MSYLQKVLQPNEVVLGTSRLHWFVFLPAILLFGLGVVVLAASYDAPSDAQQFVLLAAGVLGLFGILYWLRAWIRRATTELAVTDHRVIYKSGILSRHTIEINRAKVESVDVEQSLTGRIFGYGTLIVRGTGGSLEPIRNIADPLTFRSFITAA